MDDFFLRLVLFYPAFLFSLTIHEIAHALTAKWGGDMTATYQNRLSLNPLVHMDPVGTVILPLLMIASPGLFLFGWARPVPVNESHFRDKSWNVVVALAGPFSNLLLALLGIALGTFLWRMGLVGEDAGWWTMNPDMIGLFYQFFLMFIMLNCVLMLFNLLPVPPLDGSHVLYHFGIRGHGDRYAFWDTYARFGFIILLLVLISPLGRGFGHAVQAVATTLMRTFGFPLSG